MPKKKTYPTMESHSSKRKRARKNTESNQKLQQKYDFLLQQLDSINQSRKLQILRKTLRRSFTDSTGIVKAFSELQDSPRSLMHSLQGPLRKYDLELFTPFRERRAAIESGRLKGRRLFDREEDHNDNDLVIVDETEVPSVFSYDSDDENEEDAEKETMLMCPQNCLHHCCFLSSSSSNSSVCDECLKREVQEVEEEEEMVMEKIQVKDEKLSAETVKENRWTTMAIMLWLTIGVIVFAISVRCFAGYNQATETILVPT